MKVQMEPFTITSLRPDMSEFMCHLDNHMFYLESVVELIKVSSSIEHQSAGTYP